MILPRVPDLTPATAHDDKKGLFPLPSHRMSLDGESLFYCYCENYSDPERLCREITGDAQLYSMFRRDNSASVPCPFHGPLLFSYDKGHSIRWARPTSLLPLIVVTRRLMKGAFSLSPSSSS
ncbi:unnamed protein product [Cyprideis torosa]|uniref:Uncharacterized protein n=1 Tax=Cyprideis torosa TaxID=163714 RepID=A0A7R8ZGT2_9CRUS|nr:unnamed protein product [Cyprideis torosa]CAG0880963.1 unnamed protein product [Cyprideis torosa]